MTFSLPWSLLLRVAAAVVVALCVLALNGCNSLTRVQPYEREQLSQRKMQIPPRAVDAFLDDHIYFSKEAARGGSGGGGGGCGCN